MLVVEIVSVKQHLSSLKLHKSFYNYNFLILFFQYFYLFLMKKEERNIKGKEKDIFSLVFNRVKLR